MACSGSQSLDFRTSQRIDRNPRVHAICEAVVSKSQATSKNLNSPSNRRERSPARRLAMQGIGSAREFVGTYGAAGLVAGLASGAAAAGLSPPAGLASEAAEADASGAGAVSSDLRHPVAVRNIATSARSRTLGIASSLVPRWSRYSAKTQKGQFQPVFTPRAAFIVGSPAEQYAIDSGRNGESSGARF
jgi:hypothetical protein